jgi:hypothetical protein
MMNSEHGLPGKNRRGISRLDQVDDAALWFF